MKESMEDIFDCTRCEYKHIHPKKAVWLELSNTDGKYYHELPEGHVSQGGFPFGSGCAKTQLKEDHGGRKN